MSSSSSICQPTTKRALIIGNDQYKTSSKLMCCVNDAQDLNDKLRRINFIVTIGLNLTYREMGEKIDQFIKEISKGDLVIFFFAGHGSQSNGQDYFLPIDDEKITHSNNLQYYAINAQPTLEHIMDKRPLATVFLLDCCRRNFSDGTRRAIDSQSNCNVHAVAGSLVAYACDTNKSALDNAKNGRNGVFTHHLLENIDQPNLRIEDMMSQVCHGVMKDTNDKQIPVRTCALRDSNIYFNYKTGSLISPPEYKNDKLEKEISDEESDSLHLCDMNLTDDDMKIVAYYAIFNKQTFTMINLAGNQIGVDGIHHLVDVLKTNDKIKTLLLTNNHIGDEGMKYLTNALLLNKKMTTLGLGQNQIEDNGAKYLIYLLEKNKILTTIYLEFNQIGNEQKNILLSLKRNNKKLNINW